MREISTKTFEIGEHVMIDNVEYIVFNAPFGNPCAGCAFINKPCCNDFMCCDGIIFKRVADNCRPYLDTAEMIADWKERFGAKDWPKNSMPLIWVKEMTAYSGAVMVTAFSKHEVITGAIPRDMEELLARCTYLDGSPCGKINV